MNRLLFILAPCLFQPWTGTLVSYVLKTNKPKILQVYIQLVVQAAYSETWPNPSRLPLLYCLRRWDEKNGSNGRQNGEGWRLVISSPLITSPLFFLQSIATLFHYLPFSTSFNTAFLKHSRAWKRQGNHSSLHHPSRVPALGKALCATSLPINPPIQAIFTLTQREACSSMSLSQGVALGNTRSSQNTRTHSMHPDPGNESSKKVVLAGGATAGDPS